MADLILNNLPIVLFIVITVAVRVLQARAKARRREPPQAFAANPEPDDEEHEAAGRVAPDEAAALIDYAQTRGASSYMVEKARALTPRPAEDQVRPETIPSLSMDEGSAFSAPARSGPAATEIKKTIPAAVQEGGERSDGFFPPTRQYTALQRAVVWAEILGKPKGME